jgi:DNA polymerase-1
MEPFGRNVTGIAIVGEAPGENEDRIGRPFVGWAGGILRDEFKRHGVDIDDCILSNVVQCRPQNNVFPDNPEIIENCTKRLFKQINEAKPKLVFACGSHAIRALLKPPFAVTMSKMRGFTIPSRELNCWIACVAHPSYVGRGEEDIKRQWSRDIELALTYLEKPLPPELDRKAFEIVRTLPRAIEILKTMAVSRTWVSFDYETSSKSPLERGSKPLCVGFSSNPEFAYVIPLDFRGFWDCDSYRIIIKHLVRFLESDCPKVAQNSAFERAVSKVHFGCSVRGKVWDTMVVNHILDEREDINSLEFQVFRRYGVKFKSMVDHKRMDEEPLENLCCYNSLDCKYELRIAIDQSKEITESRRPAVELFNSALPCLSNMEQRGIKVDVPHLRSFGADLEAQLADIHLYFEMSPVGEAFRKRTGRNININSPEDIRILLFQILNITSNKKTNSGKDSVDDSVIQKAIEQTTGVANEALQYISRNRKLVKLLSTYVIGPLEKVDEKGMLHPSFMLHTTRTFRSSSENPNFQNFPKRDPEARKLRRSFVPENDYFIEADFKGCEVAVMAMLSRDPNLIEQLNKRVDIHRYWASHLFSVDLDSVSKDQRFISKNGFVFPLFYGSFYGSIARNTKLPEDQVRRTEDRFWSEYPLIKKYHQRKFDFYDKHGYVETPLGFRRHASLTRNMQINSEIQGTAFHLLLAGAILIDAELERKGYRSSLRIEIHDSLTADVVRSEVEGVVDIFRQCMTHQHYDFQRGVPMEIDLSIGENWYEMEGI